MKTYKGKFSIARIQGGQEDKPIRIEVIDEDSDCLALYVRLGFKEFAEALLGLSNVDCEFELNDSGVIGKLAQNKTEQVPVPKDRGYSRDESAEWVATALAPFEVDGWKARRSDILNHHCWSRDKQGNEFQRVVFFRHVPKETVEE